MLSERMTAAIAVVVTVAWAASFVVDILIADYDPPPSVHALMVIIVGAIFGAQAVRGR